MVLVRVAVEVIVVVEEEVDCAAARRGRSAVVSSERRILIDCSKIGYATMWTICIEIERDRGNQIKSDRSVFRKKDRLFLFRARDRRSRYSDIWISFWGLVDTRQ